MLPPAGSAENAYVKVDAAAPVSLCKDQMNFHVATHADATAVTVSANNPFELVRPNPPSGRTTLRKGSTVPWAVVSEDGEIGGMFGAFGIISSCLYPLDGTNDCHVTNAVISIFGCSAEYVKSEPNYWGHFIVSCSSGFVDQGIHKIEYHYDNCVECGSAPPESAAEFYETGEFDITTSVFIRGNEFLCGKTAKRIAIPYPPPGPPKKETVVFVAEGINAEYPCCSTRVTKEVDVL